MTLWEYKIETFICGELTRDSCEGRLNLYGRSGWELVAATEGERYHTAFFKRRLEPGAT